MQQVILKMGGYSSLQFLSVAVSILMTIVNKTIL